MHSLLDAFGGLSIDLTNFRIYLYTDKELERLFECFDFKSWKLTRFYLSSSANGWKFRRVGQTPERWEWPNKAWISRSYYVQINRRIDVMNLLTESSTAFCEAVEKLKYRSQRHARKFILSDDFFSIHQRLCTKCITRSVIPAFETLPAWISSAFLGKDTDLSPHPHFRSCWRGHAALLKFLQPSRACTTRLSKKKQTVRAWNGIRRRRDENEMQARQVIYWSDEVISI